MTRLYRAWIIWLFAGLTIFLGLWYAWPLKERSVLGNGQPFLPKMTLQNAPGGVLHVEIADEPEERIQGLSRRNALAPNHGMVFLFKTSGIYPFWMQDMRFPIDIIYLKEGVVVDVFSMVTPPALGEEPKTVEPSASVNAVLELASGEADRRNIVSGTYFQGLPSLR